MIVNYQAHYDKAKKVSQILVLVRLNGEGSQYLRHQCKAAECGLQNNELMTAQIDTEGEKGQTFIHGNKNVPFLALYQL